MINYSYNNQDDWYFDKKENKSNWAKGKVVFFNRIKNESEIKNEKNILAIYNKIRMLDSKEYPKAFIKVKKYKLYFFKAKFKKNSVLCNAKIVKIKK